MNEEGEEIVFSTRNDEMIVDYYDRIQTGELLEVFLTGGGWVGEDGPLTAKALPRLRPEFQHLLDGASRRGGDGPVNERGGSE